jgi:hypothetical protein
MIPYPYQPSPSGTTHWVYDDPSGVPEPPTLIIPSIPPLRTKGA